MYSKNLFLIILNSFSMKKNPFIKFLIFFFLILTFNNSYSSPRNVLVEYCTGTWCGWCPCGHQSLEAISVVYPRTISLAYHGGASSADPWKNFNGVEIRSLLGFSGYPTAIIDRGNTPSNPYVTYDQWFGRVQSRYSASPNSNVNIAVTSKTLNLATGELNLTLTSTALSNLTGYYKLSVVLVENNLVYPQNHYSQCGFTGYISDYVHHHNVRSMLNGPTGEFLNTSADWNANEMYTKNISTVIDPSWVTANCRIVAFVYQDNAVLALANVEQAIEENVLGTVGISNNNNEPDNYSLSQNYPNPFNPTTNIKFSIPKEGKVSFKVYDIFGKEIANYIDGVLQRGTYNVEFDGANLSSGVYFYVLKTDNFFEKKKMVLLK